MALEQRYSVLTSNNSDGSGSPYRRAMARGSRSRFTSMGTIYASTGLLGSRLDVPLSASIFNRNHVFAAPVSDLIRARFFRVATGGRQPLIVISAAEIAADLDANMASTEAAFQASCGVPNRRF